MLHVFLARLRGSLVDGTQDRGTRQVERGRRHFRM
jgi:hypothetical protein